MLTTHNAGALIAGAGITKPIEDPMALQTQQQPKSISVTAERAFRLVERGIVGIQLHGDIPKMPHHLHVTSIVPDIRCDCASRPRHARHFSRHRIGI